MPCKHFPKGGTVLYTFIFYLCTMKIIKPYGEEGSKHEQVERMFDNIAPAYDRMNHLMSFGSDRRWRKKTIKALEKYSRGRILDIACGTGDMTLEIYRRLAPSLLVGADLSDGMLEVARRKKGDCNIDFIKCDCCEAIPYPANSFDAVTVAFGVRNFEHIEKGLSEIYRVLDDGGKLAVLELAVPIYWPFKQFYKLYAGTIIPTIGGRISKDRKAYSYLPESIEAFPQRERFTSILKNCGFAEYVYTPMTFGTCILYVATKHL